jgi:nucleotidyltransferase/DNA polymerase involved in DNA repair
MSRNVVRSFRFNEDEIKEIRHCAERCGLSVSAFIRKRALNYRPPGKDMARLINEISKQGGLLKHLHTQGLGHGEKTNELLREMHKTIQTIARVVTKTTGEEAANEEACE